MYVKQVLSEGKYVSLPKLHLLFFSKRLKLFTQPEIYIQSAPNNSNETYTFMDLGRAGRFGQS